MTLPVIAAVSLALALSCLYWGVWRRGKPLYFCIWFDGGRWRSEIFAERTKALEAGQFHGGVVISDTNRMTFDPSQAGSTAQHESWPNASEVFQDQIGDVQARRI